MTASATKGGLGFPAWKAGAIYGCFTPMVYLMGIPGGWLADRVIGQCRAVLWGGVIIAMDHFTLVIRGEPAFYAGLTLIVVGTGLLKRGSEALLEAPRHHKKKHVS